MSLRGIGRVVLAALSASVGMVESATADLRRLPSVVREVTAAVGFEDADLERVWRGEIVSRRIGESSERELAIAVIMRLRESHREFYERARRGQLFEIDRTILHAEEIPPTSSGTAVFAGLRLDPDELRRLGEVTAGAEFNLSAPEIQELRRAGQEGARALLDGYRQVLAERFRAYREAGIAGVAPYARGGREEARPAQDLRRAIASLSGLDDRCPSFYRSFAEFPAREDPAVSHHFFWAVQRIQDRPTVILSHWAMQLHQEYAVVGERQFYVGQGYDALQIVVGAFSIGEGESLVFYVNRTTTGRVTGFGSSVSRTLGRRMMLREVTALFREIRGSTERGDGGPAFD